MRTAAFYGASDDLIEVVGDIAGADEFNVYLDEGDHASFRLSGARQSCIVHAFYGLHDATWCFALDLESEDKALPEWTAGVLTVRSVDVPYSMHLVFSALPDDARVELIRPKREEGREMSERERLLWNGEVPDISGGRPLPPVSVHADGLIAGGCHDYRATLVCTAVHLAGLLAASQAEATRWSLALQSVTPGGSEFADDPDRCVRYVREARHGQHETIKRFKQQRDASQAEAEELRGEVGRLREAIFSPAAAVLGEEVDGLIRLLRAYLAGEGDCDLGGALRRVEDAAERVRDVLRAALAPPAAEEGR